jgi:DNA-binding YbaB/EbfC family protein
MFKGLGQLGDMAKLMKQAQEMQKKMADTQNELESIEVIGESGGGLVKVISSAKGDFKKIELDKSLLVPSEKDVVEDLILAAIKDCKSKSEDASKKQMSKMGESLGLPEGFKLPF